MINIDALNIIEGDAGYILSEIISIFDVDSSDIDEFKL